MGMLFRACLFFSYLLYMKYHFGWNTDVSFCQCCPTEFIQGQFKNHFSILLQKKQLFQQVLWHNYISSLQLLRNNVLFSLGCQNKLPQTQCPKIKEIHSIMIWKSKAHFLYRLLEQTSPCPSWLLGAPGVPWHVTA